MTEIVVSLALGMLLGWWERTPGAVLRAASPLTSAGLVLILFCMGLALGANPEIVPRLEAIGLRAATLAALCVLGSVLAVWAVERCFIPRKGEGP